MALGIRLVWFMNTPHPLGTDGYYYVVQTEDLVGEGRLHVADGSWVFGLYGGLGWLFSAVLTTKLVAALLAALIVPAAFFAGRQRSDLLGWAGALWAASSPTITHLAADFPKNLGVGVPWFVLCFAADRRGGPRWLLLAGSSLLLATAHRTGMVWAVVALGCWGLFAKGVRREIGLGLALLGVLGLGISPWVPGFLGWGDGFRLEGQLGLGGLSPFVWFGMRSFGLAERLELSLCWLGLFAGIWTLSRREGRPSTAMGTGFLVVLLLPLYSTTSLDLGYRLALLAPLVGIPLLLEALSPVLSVRTLVGMGVLLPLSISGIDLETLPPYDLYNRLIKKVPRPLPDLLIAHQGINFLYDHRTGREAMAWAPEAELDRRQIGRLVWGISNREWGFLGDPPSRVRLNADYCYLEEQDWERFRERALAVGDPDLASRIEDWRNPSRVRPAALSRGRDR